MPTYTYRREDGSTFDIQQRFADDPLQTDPQTGQKVTRVVQAAGVIFKGSGFYVNDSRGSAKTSMTGTGKTETKAEGGADTPASTSGTSDAPAAKPEAKAEPAKPTTEKAAAPASS